MIPDSGFREEVQSVDADTGTGQIPLAYFKVTSFRRVTKKYKK